MDNIDKLKKNIDSLNGTKSLEEWASKYVAKYNKKIANISELFSDIKYIVWLEKFTLEHSRFASDDWLYKEDQISGKDNENVNKLCLLFEGLEMYAQKHEIYPEICDFGCFYRMKHNNIGYIVKILIGQGTVFICERTSIDENKEYIEFNDVIKEKQMPMVLEEIETTRK